MGGGLWERVVHVGSTVIKVLIGIVGRGTSCIFIKNGYEKFWFPCYIETWSYMENFVV